jgi:hydrogenase maturation protease
MKKTSRITIVGMGNLLLQDEGVGVHVVRILQKMALPDGVEVIDGGTSPEISSYIESAEKLIVIDAMETGGIPGSVYRILIDDLTTEVSSLTSIHEVNLISMLKIMRLLDKGPQETVIIGIQPKDMDWGTELSPELQEKIPQIVQIVLEEIKNEEPITGGISCP